VKWRPKEEFFRKQGSNNKNYSPQNERYERGLTDTSPGKWQRKKEKKYRKQDPIVLNVSLQK
jgi:hypothetical protein